MFTYKIKRELIRLHAKVSDKIFKTTKFADYQEKYSNYYQNYYLLNKNQFSFVHIPRTGGTVFHTWIEKNLTNFYTAAHNAVSLKCDPKEFKYVTILREPIQRVYSYYLMQKKNRRLPYYNHANVGLEFFLQKSWSCRNGMCKFINGEVKKELDNKLYLISINNLKNFFFVADFDNFSTDASKFIKKMNINKEIDYVKNFLPGKREISENDEEIIKKYNYYDINLFKFFKEKIL